MTGQNNLKIWLAYLTVCTVWGSTYIAIKIGVSGIAPLFFTALRFLSAGSLMLLIAKLKGLPFPKYKKDYLQIGTIGLLLLFGGTGFVGLASRFISSSATALMVASSPLIMALIQMVLYKSMRRPGWRIVAGLLIGFSGVCLLIFSGSGNMRLDPRGVTLMLIAVFMWASGSNYSRTVKPGGHMVTQIGLQMTVAGTAILLVSYLIRENHTLSVNRSSLLALGYLIFFGSMLAYSSYIYILHHWPLSRVSTYAYVNPVIAVLLGWLILDEPITLSVVISMLVILAGVILVNSANIKNTPSQSSKIIKKAA